MDDEPAPAAELGAQSAAALSAQLSKVGAEDALRPQLQGHAPMFQSVADLFHWIDTTIPASAHPDLFRSWCTTADEAMDAALEAAEVELTPAEEQQFEVAKEAGFEVVNTFLKRAVAAGWSSQTPAERRQHIERLLAAPQVPQRTVEWYAQGKQVLTASEFATLFKSPRAVSQLVLGKAAPAPTDATAATNRLACMTCEMGPFDWGVRFEPVVKQVLATRWGVTILEAGRIVHPQDPLVAASPDGLIVDATDPARVGRLVEIKCPISRAVGGAVPFEYWCQMQIQMEVTDIDECEYVEVKLQSLRGQETEWPATSPKPDGYVWLVQDVTRPGCPMSYRYTEEDAEAAAAAGLELIETIPWRVETFHNKLVARDRTWFASTAAARASFWTEVAAARAGTYTPVPSSRPAKATAAAAAAAGRKPGQVIVFKEGADPVPSPACLIVDDEPPEPPLESAPVEAAVVAPLS